MLPRQHRLTRPAEFRSVLRGGDERARARAGNGLMIVHLARPNDPAGGGDVPSQQATHPPRAGFVVSKAVGNSVIRHRVLRRLRALMLPWMQTLPAGTDVVVRARPEAAGASSAQLADSLQRAMARMDMHRAPTSGTTEPASRTVSDLPVGSTMPLVEDSSRGPVMA